MTCQCISARKVISRGHQRLSVRGVTGRLKATGDAVVAADVAVASVFSAVIGRFSHEISELGCMCKRTSAVKVRVRDDDSVVELTSDL